MVNTQNQQNPEYPVNKLATSLDKALTKQELDAALDAAIAQEVGK